MPNINIDDILRHQITLARLETRGYNSFIAPSLAKTLRDIRRLLADYDNITSQRQLKAIETAITKIITEQQGWAALTTELDSLAVYENEFYAKLIASGTTAAAAERVSRLASNTMLVLRSGEKYNTGFWPDFVRNNLGSQAQRVNNIVRTAYAGQISVAESRKQISTLFDGLLSREAEALARTGYTHYASVGRQAFAAANADIVTREVPIVTFDSRLSDTCASISARYGIKGWPAGQSPIGMPPFHFNAVASGELVRTSTGLKPIEQVRAGEFVLTHKGRFKRVLNTMRKRPDTDVIRVIRTDTGRTIRVTDDHPLLLAGKGWVRADVLKVGDNLFQNQRKDVKPTVGISVAERNSYNYPSAFDGDEVFSLVNITSSCMAPAINLDNNHPTPKGEVRYPIISYMLPYVIGEANRIKPSAKSLLTYNLGPKLPISLPMNKGLIARFSAKRVSFFHSLRMLFMDFAIPLVKTVRPMVLPNAYTGCDVFISCNRTALGSAHRFNAMNLTPPAHSPVSETEFSLNFPEGHSVGEVVSIEEAGEIGFISKFKHEITSCVVESISIVANYLDVYNLEVEDDNSYLVNDIVTHNCRTTIVPLASGQELTGTRASKGDKPGQIRASTTITEFIRDQSPEFQNELLGPERAALFRQGKLDIASLTDRNLQPLTLKELRERGG